MTHKHLTLALLCLLMGSCHVGPVYVPPETPVPEEFKWKETQEPTAIPCLYWWEIFNDPVLNKLEEQALCFSPTLIQAIARVNEEYALLRSIAATDFPFLTFDPIDQASMQLINTAAGSSLQNISPNTGGNVPPVAGGTGGVRRLQRVRFQNIQLPFTLSYELDLWGQREDSIMAQLARAQASAQNYDSVWLRLTADVASAYFQMRGLQTQIQVLKATLAARQKEVDINYSRYKGGLANEADFTLAKVELANAQFDIVDAERLLAIQEDALAVFVGDYASEFDLTVDAFVANPPIVPTGLPSQLLQRRPDIAEAEREMAAASEDVAYYYADFFPTLSLSGTLGMSSPSVANLFQWRARLWAYAIQSTSTLFDAGQKIANLDGSKARYLQAVANYEQTILVAFREVEDALVNLSKFDAEFAAANEGAKNAEIALNVYRNRYRQGLNNYLDVVQNERTLLGEQLKLVDVLSNKYQNTILLIRALGGGWNCCDDNSEDGDESEDEEVNSVD